MGATRDFHKNAVQSSTCAMKKAQADNEMEANAKRMSEKYTTQAEAHLKKQRAAQKSCDKLNHKEEGAEKEAAAKRKVKEEKRKKAARKRKEEAGKKSADATEVSAKKEEKAKKAAAKKKKHGLK